jgi:hypothetical protein
LRQVRSTICFNRREIAHTRLEAVAIADKSLQPNSHFPKLSPSN